MDGLVAQCSARLLQQVCPWAGRRALDRAAPVQSPQWPPQAAAVVTTTPAPGWGLRDPRFSGDDHFLLLEEENPSLAGVVLLSLREERVSQGLTWPARETPVRAAAQGWLLRPGVFWNPARNLPRNCQRRSGTMSQL